MPSYDERLAALEQTAITRAELTEAIEKLTRQQAQNLRDRSYETAIPLGILTDDVRILKENIGGIRVRMNEGFTDLSHELYSMDEKLTKRFVSLETRLGSLETKFDEHTSLLTQILARLPEKP